MFRPFRSSTHPCETWSVVWRSVSSLMFSKIWLLQSLCQHTSASRWHVRTRSVSCAVRQKVTKSQLFKLLCDILLMFDLFCSSLDWPCCMLFCPMERSCCLQVFLLSPALVTLRPGRTTFKRSWIKKLIHCCLCTFWGDCHLAEKCKYVKLIDTKISITFLILCSLILITATPFACKTAKGVSSR